LKVENEKRKKIYAVKNSPPFNSPSLSELERGIIGKKTFSHRPSLFQKRGDGGELNNPRKDKIQEQRIKPCDIKQYPFKP
jgi:hypothetical protein